MSFSYPITINVIIFFAVLARTSAFVLSLPIIESQNVPHKYRIGFVTILTFILMTVLPQQWKDAGFFSHLTTFKLVLLFLSEFMLGLTVSLIIRIIMEIVKMGGFLMDRSMAFTMAQEVDPSSQIQGTLLSNLFVQLFIIMFLISDAHLEIIRIAAASFEIVKPGTFLITGETAKSMVALSNQIFVMGLKIALPIFIVILFINIGLGLMARVGQDFPVLMLSFPLRIGLGFLILMSFLPIYIFIIKNLNTRLINLITQLL